MKITEWAEEKPLFTFKDAERAFEYNKDYLKVKLHRLVKRKELKRIEKGKYTVHNDPMIYGTYIETPSFFSLWTALKYYNLTTQEPVKKQVITRKTRKNLEKINFYSTKKIFGYRKKIYKGFPVFIADKERLLLDCLRCRNVPVEELKELIKEINIDKTIKYASKLGNKAVKKRTGYLIQKKKNTTEKTSEKLEKLRKDIDKNYTPLDLSKPNKGEKDSKWRIKVNTDAA